MKKNKHKKIINTGLFILFLSIILLVVKVIPQINKKSTEEKSINISSESDKQETNNTNNSSWIGYSNEKYFVQFSHPNLLRERESSENEKYLFFVVFEETVFSPAKGIAFGVSVGGLEKEIEKTKADFSSQGEYKIVKNEELNNLGDKAVYLEIEPEDESFEKRGLIIIQKENYTYSFSTVPEQIQKLRESIEFIK